LETVGAFFFGCLVDLDHFAAAGSLRLTDATNLQSRPLGHCLTVMLVYAALVYVTTEALQAGKGWGMRAALLSLRWIDSPYC
jgi:hypothetical protein